MYHPWNIISSLKVAWQLKIIHGQCRSRSLWIFRKICNLESAEPQVWLCYRFCWREALLKMDFSSMFPLDHSTMTCSLLFGAQQLQLCLLCLTKAQMSQSFRKQLQDLGMYSTCTYVNILSAIAMYIYFRL